MAPPLFSTSAQLQEYLLREGGPGTLVVVPHQRLAHQVWQRQRAQALAAGQSAWEPLPLMTLEAWMCRLFQSLWPEEALAPFLTRLALWRRALAEVPPPPGLAPDLAAARALDEAFDTLCRHGLPPGGPPGPEDLPLVAWRRQVSAAYARLLRDGGWLPPGELPAYLLAALEAGKITLPERVLVAGLESPAPAEAAWLAAVARRTRVLSLRVSGAPENVKGAVVLPDSGQEMEWAAARLLEFARSDGLPLHRLALTAAHLADYAPRLPRVLGELLGPPQAEDGWAYNFSKGDTLAQAPLFQAALLPLRFLAGGETREDLVSLLLSPYYKRFREHREVLPRWDVWFREHRLDQGWEALRNLASRRLEGEGDRAREPLRLLEKALSSLAAPRASGGEWAARLHAAWQTLGFPPGPETAAHWPVLEEVLRELGQVLAAQPLSPKEFLDWLQLGAQDRVLAGPGVQDAGLQVLGLLEMRGLDFDRVLCLGMNSGQFPPPPRALPLLSPGEKRAVLGGTYESQHRFYRGLYEGLLGTAAGLVLTRPQAVEGEEQVATPFYLGAWDREDLGILSRPHGAWLRAPAVRAALSAPAAPAPEYAYGPVAVAPSSRLSLSRLMTGLACPCRFLLENLLGLEELPEIVSGLDPRERGSRLHQTLARFAREFQKLLDQSGRWDQARAEECLRAAGRQLFSDLQGDLHWDAEWERWLGEGEGGRGFLWEWLRLEAERYHQGWRWCAVEAAFDGLAGEDWGFTVAGRIDRIDHHPEDAALMVWDYKSGEVPGARQVFDTGEEFQLPCYLLAVARGRLAVPAASSRGAGFIGLKSAREKHLKYEDFPRYQDRWPEVLAAFEARVRSLSRALAAGDFRPGPATPRSCDHCPYQLICGYTPPPEPEADEDEEAGQ